MSCIHTFSPFVTDVNYQMGQDGPVVPQGNIMWKSDAPDLFGRHGLGVERLHPEGRKLDWLLCTETPLLAAGGADRSRLGTPDGGFVSDPAAAPSLSDAGVPGQTGGEREPVPTILVCGQWKTGSPYLTTSGWKYREDVSGVCDGTLPEVINVQVSPGHWDCLGTLILPWVANKTFQLQHDAEGSNPCRWREYGCMNIGPELLGSPIPPTVWNNYCGYVAQLVRNPASFPAGVDGWIFSFAFTITQWGCGAAGCEGIPGDPLNIIVCEDIPAEEGPEGFAWCKNPVGLGDSVGQFGLLFRLLDSAPNHNQTGPWGVHSFTTYPEHLFWQGGVQACCGFETPESNYVFSTAAGYAQQNFTQYGANAGCGGNLGAVWPGGFTDADPPGIANITCTINP